MKLYELIKKDQYKSKAFFTGENNIKLVLARGQKVAKFLKAKCSPWLSQTNNGKIHAFRGFSRGKQSDMAFTKKIRKNRVPKDSGRQEHNSYDFMIKKCGMIANRSNAAFVVGSSFTASEFGQPFVTIPIGKFNYTWHKHFDDWTGDVPYNEYLVKKNPDVEKLGKDAVLKMEWEQELKSQKETIVTNFARIKKFFDWMGIKITVASVVSIALHLRTLYDYPDSGSMGVGTPKNPFPYLKQNEYPTTGSYWNRTVIKNKPMIELFNLLKTLNKQEKSAIRKKVVAARGPANAIRLASNWIKTNKTFEQYKRELVRQIRITNQENASSFIVGKDKPSQLDMKELNNFCKDLYGDDGSLIKAIKSNNEIMVASASVIGIEEDFYVDVIIPMLHGKTPKISENQATQILQGSSEDDSNW